MAPSEVCASDAWISPDGAFYPVEDCGHSVAAAEILPDADWPGDVLESRGWVHLSYGNPRMAVGRKFSQAQLNILFDVLDAFAEVVGSGYADPDAVWRHSRLREILYAAPED